MPCRRATGLRRRPWGPAALARLLLERQLPGEAAAYYLKCLQQAPNSLDPSLTVELAMGLERPERPASGEEGGSGSDANAKKPPDPRIAALVAHLERALGA